MLLPFVGMGRTALAGAFVVLAVLLAATASEAAVALRVVSLGDHPGEEPVGRSLLFAAALLALLAAAVLFAVLAARSSGPASTPLALIDLAGAAFLLVRFHSFDPYFAPNVRRFSDDGAVSRPWLYAVVGLGLLAAALARARPRVGLGLSIALLPLVAATAVATGVGH